jgi:hypothetical protein
MESFEIELTDEELKLDWDNIEEVYDDGDDEPEEDEMGIDDIDEATRFKRVVRKGKVIRKRVSTRPGYKMLNGKEVRISQSERMARKRAQKKAAIKRRSKRSIIAKKAKRSRLKRRTFGAR